MLLTISTTHRPATDLGYLLHKNPGRCQTFELSFGHAHIFYPEVAEDRCSACLLLDVDPVGLVRGKGDFRGGLLGQYVSDRPFVASSFMSVAISRVLGSAMQGTSRERSELAATPIPLKAQIDVLPVRGGEDILGKLFQPLGYAVSAVRHPLDVQFPEWGESSYFSVAIEKTTTLSELLTHLYVLIPVFDHQKHYFVGDDEVQKLLDKGEGWLANHPEKEFIARRYFKSRAGLARQALAQLVQEEAALEPDEPDDKKESAVQQTLNEQRLGAVLAVLRASGARKVLDLGCGEGKLIRELFADKQFDEIVGLDVSIRALEVAHRRLCIDMLPQRQKDRLRLIHGSLTYRDRRLEGFDAAALVEVIEHLDPPRLRALERVVFEFARPKSVVVTTPNREYNVMWESLPAGEFRHGDHRFEWSREEFQSWASGIGNRFGYAVRFVPVGPEDPNVGSPTQMAVFGPKGVPS